MAEQSRNLQLNLIGEKVPDPVVHCCNGCDLPICIYGRLLPCKHIFCYECAMNKCSHTCSRCDNKVDRVERLDSNKVHVCLYGAPKHSRDICGRTYLSDRDLDAHIVHRFIIGHGSSAKREKISNNSPAPPGDVHHLLNIPLR